MKDDPFGTLGLPARADLSDDEVRAAWKRIAAATHPDRDDGGDPARFSAAAAAYDTLRTSFGRGEALADLGLAGTGLRAGRHGARRARPTGARRLGVGGRGRRIALRAAAAASVTAAALLAVGWTPATVGLLTGALTWAAVTSRRDRPGRGDRLPRTSTRRAATVLRGAHRFLGYRRTRGREPGYPGDGVIRGTGRWRRGGLGR